MSTSSGNGGGKGFFDNVLNLESLSGGGNFFANLGNDLHNIGVQGATGGYLGFENGKVSNGVTTNVLKKAGQETVSGLKEVTGAKAAEQANEEARRQFDQARIDAEKERAASIAQVGRDQLAMSQKAGAARATASSRSANRGMTIGSIPLGDDEKDFLGL